jgi:hypothetical protein
MSHHQNAGQNHNIKMANAPYESVAEFKYLGTRVTDLTFIHEEIRSRTI